MPATKRSKPLYSRGDYKLVRRPGRRFLEIVWYDSERARERSASAGTADVAAGREALDRLFLEKTGGGAFCPTCGQRRGIGGVLVASAIADYLVLNAEKDSIVAIRARLTHVLDDLVRTGQEGIACEAVDEAWIARFRKRLARVPVVSPHGAKRERALSTIENSVLQLRAAIAACGGIVPRFKAIQPKELNRTPQHRSTVGELVRMFRHCLEPEGGKQPIDRQRRERAGLLAFLRVSVATMARPDAAHDLSTAPARRQWNAEHRVIGLNPVGRRQTRKHRATVPAARQIVATLDAATGPVVPSISVKSAWTSMARALSLPGDGEGGMKLIRRSVANIVRQRLPAEAWGELEIWLGHARFDEVSDLYAPYRPDYLRRALAAVEGLIDEIEAAVPGAFTSVATDPPEERPT